MRTFTTILTKLLSHPKLPSIFKKTYVKKPRFWNYAFICGVGVGVNQVALHFFILYVPLWVANFISIFTAWVWNYQNAIGSFAIYWGLSD